MTDSDGFKENDENGIPLDSESWLAGSKKRAPLGIVDQQQPKETSTADEAGEPMQDLSENTNASAVANSISIADDSIEENQSTLLLAERNPSEETPSALDKTFSSETTHIDSQKNAEKGTIKEIQAAPAVTTDTSGAEDSLVVDSLEGQFSLEATHEKSPKMYKSPLERSQKSH